MRSEPMTMAARREQPDIRPVEAPFHRLLVAVDGTEAAASADAVASEWTQEFGGEVRRVQMPEAGIDAVVRDVAEQASAFRADIIVLGCDRRRLARHRLAHSLRERLTRATELPVLVAPGVAPAARRHRAEASERVSVHDEGGELATRRGARV